MSGEPKTLTEKGAVMDKAEYIRRYAAELRARSDVAMSEAFARITAEAHWLSNVEAGEPCGDPEGDACTEMSYWDE